jgi:hypothetical protein
MRKRGATEDYSVGTAGRLSERTDIVIHGTVPAGRLSERTDESQPAMPPFICLAQDAYRRRQKTPLRDKGPGHKGLGRDLGDDGVGGCGATTVPSNTPLCSGLSAPCVRSELIAKCVFSPWLLIACDQHSGSTASDTHWYRLRTKRPRKVGLLCRTKSRWGRFDWPPCIFVGHMPLLLVRVSVYHLAHYTTRGCTNATLKHKPSDPESGSWNCCRPRPARSQPTPEPSRRTRP